MVDCKSLIHPAGEGWFFSIPITNSAGRAFPLTSTTKICKILLASVEIFRTLNSASELRAMSNEQQALSKPPSRPCSRLNARSSLLKEEAIGIGNS
jgi:hypothetical protein